MMSMMAQLFLLLSGLILTTMALGALLIVGFCGSATFSKSACKRNASTTSAVAMLVILLIEALLFQACQLSFYWTIPYVACTVLVIWSFIKTVFTDPGTPESPEWRAWVIEMEGRGLLNNGIPRTDKKGEKGRGTFAPGEISHCELCDRFRPERAHHCKHCGTCVLRMDHHCPMVGNCVGWRNIKFYVLLQFWQFVNCAIFLFTPGGPGLRCLWGDVNLSRVVNVAMYAGSVWAFTLLLISGRMFAITVWLAAKNETHVEGHFTQTYDGEGGNPYTLPSAGGNLKQIFGKMDWMVLLPTRPTGQACCGTSFPLTPRGTHGAQPDESAEGPADQAKAVRAYGTV